jgi:MoxR-like ATPase
MPESNAAAESAAEQCVRLIANLQKTVFAEQDQLRVAVACLIAGGHLLIEGAPGIGKTVLARSLAQSIGADFRRMQFTNDLMPADVLGVSIFDRQKSSFEFKPGPVFANVFLADEINRANPKTQSALLEAMNEGSISVDAGTFSLPRPFFVLATENPVEFEGTYPLPEAQVDRFLVRLRLDYPDPEHEKKLYAVGSTEPRIRKLEPVLDCEQIKAIQRTASDIAMEPTLLDYAHEVVSRTRKHPNLELGVSPRGALLWINTARAMALMDGRTYLVPDDLKKSAVPALGHRLHVLVAQDTQEISSAQDRVIREIIDGVEVPR